MTLYASTAGLLISQLRATVAVHTTSDVDGQCITCHVPGPCIPRCDALHVLATWHRREPVDVRRVNP